METARVPGLWSEVLAGATQKLNLAQIIKDLHPEKALRLIDEARADAAAVVEWSTMAKFVLDVQSAVVEACLKDYQLGK